MWYLLAFMGGGLVGILTASMMAMTREEDDRANLDLAIKDAYLKGYEAAIKDYEK